LGEAAYRWIDFLASAGQTLWQVMPLGPTGYGDSPYQSFSAFAGNPYLIDLPTLVDEGLLERADLDSAPAFSETAVDYGSVIPFKIATLTRAYKGFTHNRTHYQADFAQFCERERYWLNDYALFMALKDAHGGNAWNSWPEAIRLRDPQAIAQWQDALEHDIEKFKVWQWLFFKQWSAVKRYANRKGIAIIGDIPIFIAYDSADAWANQQLFFFDDVGHPTVVAGVPPDYFSVTGQRWGNPLYRWKTMQDNGFRWWTERFQATLKLVDIVRIDHFRGFEAYWEIPASEPTAVKGRWVKGPGQPFFDAIKSALGDNLPIIAEDLGVITPAVEALRDNNGLPGMKVLQFAFGGDASDPYLPHNYEKNCVVYSGTHDNDTTKSWYDKAPENERDFVRRYLAHDGSNVAWAFVRLANASVADTAIVPLQDVLGLGAEARMNTPGVAAGNWSWRVTWEQIPDWIAGQLYELAELFNRIPGKAITDTAYRQSSVSSVEEA
jgi:4-alpha-glucanotransferase